MLTGLYRDDENTKLNIRINEALVEFFHNHTAFYHRLHFFNGLMKCFKSRWNIFYVRTLKALCYEVYEDYFIKSQLTMKQE